MQPGDFNKMRSTMRKFWCSDGKNTDSTPCQIDAYVQKIKSTSDSTEKEKLVEEHKKAIGGDASRATRVKKEFWDMFTGYCEGSNDSQKVKICENPLLRKAKEANHMPSIAGH